MKCAWVGWATGRTIPECVNMGLANDTLIAMGLWLVLGLRTGLWSTGFRLRSCL